MYTEKSCLRASANTVELCEAGVMLLSKSPDLVCA